MSTLSTSLHQILYGYETMLCSVGVGKQNKVSRNIAQTYVGQIPLMIKSEDFSFLESYENLTKKMGKTLIL